MLANPFEKKVTDDSSLSQKPKKTFQLILNVAKMTSTDCAKQELRSVLRGKEYSFTWDVYKLLEK
jgi:hypothetical protein